MWQWATLGLSLTRLLIAVTGGTLQRNGAGFSRVLILALGAGGRASAMGKPQSSGGLGFVCPPGARRLTPGHGGSGSYPLVVNINRLVLERCISFLGPLQQMTTNSGT